MEPQLGVIDDVFIDPITDGALSVLRELGMIEGEPIVAANPLVISDRVRVYSEYEGIWHKDALVKTGDFVTKGTELGSSQITLAKNCRRSSRRRRYC